MKNTSTSARDLVLKAIWIRHPLQTNAAVPVRPILPNFFTIGDEDLAAVITMAKTVAAAIEKTVKPEGLNLAQANGVVAGQTVFHFHIHIIPRRTGDSVQMTWVRSSADKAELAALREKIQGHL